MIKILFSLGILAAAAVVPMPKNYGIVEEPSKVPNITYKKVWTCPDCNPREKYVLSVLQKRTHISENVFKYFFHDQLCQTNQGRQGILKRLR